MTSKKFDELYGKLNDAQRRAVDSVEGPVMVIAGPGTGKTQILTLRIAQILQKTDTNPGNILALTFTESGVFSMRSRLSEIIGSAAYSVIINTFHGFCNDIIKNYPESFPRIIGSESIDEVSQIKIIEDIISRLPLLELKPFGEPFYYLKTILSRINDLKREGVPVPRFFEIVAESEKNFELIPDLYHEKGAHKGKMKGEYQKLQKQIFKNKELTKVYEAYEAALEEQKLYDYSDMIMEVLRVLTQNKNLLLILQETYQYVLVDEHQDTNNAQNKILELLLNFHPNPNIFVVGDEKQAIYRFQGASLENFLYFKKLYPAAELIFLEENYRSAQSILDVAHSLIAGERLLKARAPHENKNIKIYSFSNNDVENYFLAKDIKRRIDEGTSPDEIAVLYRDNKDAFSVINFLKKFGIKFSVASDEDLFGDLDIKKFLMLMYAVGNFGNEEELFKLMHADFLELDPLDIYKIIDYRNKNRISGYEIIKSEHWLSQAGVAGSDKFLNLYKNLSRWATDAKNKTLPEVFEVLLRESGFLSAILRDTHPAEGLDKITDFFDEVRILSERHSDFGLNDLFAHLDMIREHKILIKKKASIGSDRGVRLMTAHKSKGLEFEYVYIVNAYDGHWGNKRRLNLLKLPSRVFSLLNRDAEGEGDIEDERRLFYVAITRAKKEVVITYAKASPKGDEQLPCQFLGELKAELTDKVDTEIYEKTFEDEKVMMFSESKVSGIDIKDREFIKKVFDKNGFSVTALNNYLMCPWKYFYTNLLRIPKAMERHQIYGTAVHAALKDFFGVAANHTKEYLVDQFKFYLEKENQLTPVDKKELLERGIGALSGYYDFHKNEWASKTLTEFNIPGILLTPEIRLTGKIDKIELVGGNNVNVVDYKTGKPKTRGEIEGTTQSSDGAIKRQLVFYNLLLNKWEEGRYKMAGGEIDFIEPDDKGKYRHEKFIILPEEVLELEALIKKVCAEIFNLEFWDKKCEEKDCEWCGLRELMR